ncbi:kinesin-like protein KIN-12E [Esox lucius]|uniref:kinesin-like protein KIN-12E n=1 Tax=Esox lucius TaxID=8010 RepID=UPI001476DD5A|nr:kinesin-like protein KIN-12E [Esox lucius]
MRKRSKLRPRISECSFDCTPDPRYHQKCYRAPEAGHCKIRWSFIHIFNEKIYDLLESQQPAELCHLHDVEESVVLDGLREVEVGSSQGLLQLYRTGAANRRTVGISKGELSSMSHVIFNIVLVHLKSQGNGKLPLKEGVSQSM